MNQPTCVHCEKELSDWKGNVMVNEHEYTREAVVKELQVWCFDCTKSLDKKGYGKQYHHIWHLDWLKEDFFSFAGDVLDNYGDKEVVRRWEKKAVQDFFDLGAMLYQGKTIAWRESIKE
jgi:hypothetical protein